MKEMTKTISDAAEIEVVITVYPLLGVASKNHAGGSDVQVVVGVDGDSSRPIECKRLC
jgi:hypothetical protein